MPLIESSGNSVEPVCYTLGSRRIRSIGSGTASRFWAVCHTHLLWLRWVELFSELEGPRPKGVRDRVSLRLPLAQTGTPISVGTPTPVQLTPVRAA